MDLNAPLGMTPPPPDEPPQPTPPAAPRRRRGLAIGVVACVVAALGLGALAVVFATADPHGGEPYGIAAIAPAAPKPARQVAAPAMPAPDPSPTGSIPPATRMTSLLPQSGAAPQAGAGPQGGPLVIDVAKALAERRGQGGTTTSMLALPTNSNTDTNPTSTPSSAEPARPRLESVRPDSARPDVANAARIAIVVAGMGLGQTATRTATEIMPPAVTFAFSPYGDKVGAAVAAAKAKGHEILLQMPMQDAGAPAPGPYALHAGEPGPEVAVDAAWAFGRLDGYAGVSNFLGAAVTSDKPVMDALLKAVGARGLFYVDDGTSHRSLGPALAQQLGLPSVRADVVIDATADPNVVRANLEALAAIAKRKGAAIGLASGLPEHLAAIAAFASGLGARDIALVPVGALVDHPPAVAAAR